MENSTWLHVGKIGAALPMIPLHMVHPGSNARQPTPPPSSPIPDLSTTSLKDTLRSAQPASMTTDHHLVQRELSDDSFKLTPSEGKLTKFGAFIDGIRSRTFQKQLDKHAARYFRE